MVGLIYPDDGDVLIHGQSVPYMTDEELAEMRKRFGLLFQDGALFGSMNVFDNVAFPLRQHTDTPEDEIARARAFRARPRRPAVGRRAPAARAVGGMRKRAGFARALVLDPDIVLFDEPDSGLDPVRTSLLGALIQDIHEYQMLAAEDRGSEHLPCYCLITHNIDLARNVADYLCVVWKGRIVEAGPKASDDGVREPVHRPVPHGQADGPVDDGLMASSEQTSLARVLARALENGEENRVRRLRHARTTVRFTVAGASDRATLLLDREDVAVDENGSEAEVNIELTRDQAETFLRGELRLPVAVVGGAVVAHGPVRKYLQVDPIVRGLLAAAHADESEN